MDKMYQDKVVMITGAASGFGAMAAQRFADEGAKLGLSDVNGEKLNEVAEELRAQGFEVVADVVNVADEAQVKAHVDNIAAAFGTIHVGINNAGIGHDVRPMHYLTTEDFDLMMDVNAKGVFLCMKYQIPLMQEHGQGAILNTASAAGLMGAGHLSLYAAAKHAVVGMTKAVADENAKRGIRVNALCPSFSATPMVEEMADIVGDRSGLSREDAYSHIASRVPMGRVSKPEEVVQAMLWINAPENSFMTGQAIAIDGGLSAV
ncbi:NAD(P)-dependent dehydrogenase, short-chain alcohol dehydrogenase family [Shimia haliotis]|uniref:NAD(P)-dependent dehydrogenase, short-chain alcohol dehydrogenase family n=2 Tax=Shimia haliotis TaxID=1280847 RepID=A0A1I4EVX2_9RHOB|nr:NAD(P)-dependent dehydrogenase, short-chain alcohol dehydrogenase family [Shimia haliotis]